MNVEDVAGAMISDEAENNQFTNNTAGVDEIVEEAFDLLDCYLGVGLGVACSADDTVRAVAEDAVDVVLSIDLENCSVVDAERFLSFAVGDEDDTLLIGAT